MNPAPLQLFRVYPEGRRLYFRVYLWATLREMRGYVREAWEIYDRRAWAWTIADDAYCADTGKKLPLLGEIHLSRRHSPPEIIAHEVGHAVIAWAQRIRVPIVDDPEDDRGHEERFCYATGRMNQRILDALRRGGHWTE
jgi:hypothetical protein